jgi:predicted phosphodiesterase
MTNQEDPMRIAIFSDVHGNLTALEAVLKDMDEQEAFDTVFFAGDLCYLGPRPAECVALLKSREHISSVYGNTDQWIDGPPLLSDDIEEEARKRIQRIHDIASWTAEKLPPMERAWLRELPFHRRVSPTVNPRDDLFIVHANPKDVNQLIFPGVRRQKEIWGEQRQSDHELSDLLEDLVADTVAFGHLHIPFIRRWNDIQLVNVSSVSAAGDGDRRAKYAILEWDGEEWNASHRYVDWDVEEEIEAYRREMPPGWEEAVETLEREGTLPQKV